MIHVLIRDKPDRASLQLYYVNPISGREVTRSAETADRGQAERAAARWEEELSETLSPGKMSWDRFRQRFEDEHTAKLSYKAQMSYATALNHFERLMGNPSLLSAVDASTISKFQAAMRGEKMGEQSICTYLGHLRSSLRWAASIGILAIAPTVKLPKMGKRRFARGRPLRDEEFEKMVEVAPKIVGNENAAEWQRLLRGLWLSGLRLEESFRLSWDTPPVRVDLDTGRWPRIIWYAEGHKARRDEACPITPDFADFLREAKDRTGKVFHSLRLPTRHVNAHEAGITISKIGESAGVVVNEHGKFASAHDLRRTFATRWAPRVRPVTLQALMRHSSIETTLKFYVDLHCDDVGAEIWGVPIVPNSVPKRDRKKKASKNGRP